MWLEENAFHHCVSGSILDLVGWPKPESDPSPSVTVTGLLLGIGLEKHPMRAVESHLQVGSNKELGNTYCEWDLG